MIKLNKDDLIKYNINGKMKSYTLDHFDSVVSTMPNQYQTIDYEFIYKDMYKVKLDGVIPREKIKASIKGNIIDLKECKIMLICQNLETEEYISLIHYDRFPINVVFNDVYSLERLIENILNDFLNYINSI